MAEIEAKMFLEFELIAKDRPVNPLLIEVVSSTIAGWAGRDAAKMEAHILELEALGVKRPAETPTFYPVSSARLTQSEIISCLGTHSSGEVEALFIASEGEVYVGVSSDHTDREVEAYDVAVSKQICDKPVGKSVWPLSDVIDHWDQLILKSEIEENGSWTDYQTGTVSELLSPDMLFKKFGKCGSLPDGTAMLGGTLPAHGGVRASGKFRASLVDPILDRSLDLRYVVQSLAWQPPKINTER